MEVDVIAGDVWGDDTRYGGLIGGDLLDSTCTAGTCRVDSTICIPHMIQNELNRDSLYVFSIFQLNNFNWITFKNVTRVTLKM